MKKHGAIIGVNVDTTLITCIDSKATNRSRFISNAICTALGMTRYMLIEYMEDETVISSVTLQADTLYTRQDYLDGYRLAPGKTRLRRIRARVTLFWDYNKDGITPVVELVRHYNRSTRRSRGKRQWPPEFLNFSR